jgi:hypothetical protein
MTGAEEELKTMNTTHEMYAERLARHFERIVKDHCDPEAYTKTRIDHWYDKL